MFRIRRGLSTELFQVIDGKPNYEAPSKTVTLEENCWYLCTDTAELFLGVKVTDPDTGESLITLKRINSDDSQSNDEINPELAEDLAELQGEITTIKNAGYITKTQLEEAISNIEHPPVSFDGYATEEYVDNAIDAIDIPEVPANVSDFENDAGYLTQQNLEGLATESYVVDAIASIEFPEASDPDLTNYYTKGEVDELIPEATDLTDYFTKQEVTTAIAEAIAEHAKEIPVDELTEVIPVVNNQILPTVEALTTAKADDVPFKEETLVVTSVGGWATGDNLAGKTVAEIFAKLFGLGAGTDIPEEPKGIIDTIIENKIPMYQIDENDNIVEVPHVEPISYSVSEASTTKDGQSGFYKVVDDNGEIIEAGYQHFTEAKEPWYMVALPEEFDVTPEGNTLLQTWNDLESKWGEASYVLTGDYGEIVSAYEDAGLEPPVAPSGYRLWADLSMADPGTVYRYIIKENKE